MFVEPRANYVLYYSCWKKETDEMKLFNVWLTVSEKDRKLKSKKCAIKKAMVEWIFFPLFGNTPKSIKSNINVTWHVCIYIKMKNDTGLRHVAYPHNDIHSEWEKKTFINLTTWISKFNWNNCDVTVIWRISSRKKYASNLLYVHNMSWNFVLLCPECKPMVCQNRSPAMTYAVTIRSYDCSTMSLT